MIRVTNNASPALPGNEPGDDFNGLNRHWHLAKDQHQITVAEFEYSLIRAWEAFGHWQSECLASVSGLTVSGTPFKHWFAFLDYRAGVGVSEDIPALITHVLIARVEARY